MNMQLIIAALLGTLIFVICVWALYAFSHLYPLASLWR